MKTRPMFWEELKKVHFDKYKVANMMEKSSLQLFFAF